MRIQSLWAPLSAFYFCHRRGDLCAPLCTRWDRLHTYKFCERRAEEEDMSSFLPPTSAPLATTDCAALGPASCVRRVRRCVGQHGADRDQCCDAATPCRRAIGDLLHEL